MPVFELESTHDLMEKKATSSTALESVSNLVADQDDRKVANLPLRT